MIEGVLFDNAVLDMLLGSTRKHAPHEAGGLVLGNRKEGYLHVIEASLPTEWDHQSRVAFLRSAKGHRIKALRLWKKSHGKVDWLGEWHSHPGFLPNPSWIDRQNWKRLTAHHGQVMVFPICDGQDTAVWLHSPGEVRPARLSVRSKDNLGVLFAR